MPQPNVLFVLCDQLQARALGCYGNDEVSTPTIDQLAEDGVRFENAYTPHPVCTPARGALQTGTLRWQHGATQNWSPLDTHPSRPMMARSFRDAGYHTGYIGKWHLDGHTGLGATVGSDEGDEVGFVPPGRRRAGYTWWRGFNNGHVHHKQGHPMFTRDGELYWEREGEWQPTVETDMVQEFIADNAADPFFSFISWGPPHNPYDAPGDYAENYPPEELDLPPNVPDEIEDEARENRSEYYGMIEALDDELARLLDTLEEQGIREDTIIVFTADHGDFMGARGKFGKGNPLEESANVPLLFNYPGEIEGGRVSSGLISLVDLFPTLAGLCDVPIPDLVRGSDYSDHVRGDAPEPTEPIYMASYPRGGDWRAIRAGDYMLWLKDKMYPSELYDVEADPYQQHNLVDEADPELLGELLSRYYEQAHRFSDNDTTGRGFRHDASWADDYDDAIAEHIDIDYESYVVH